MLWIGTAVTFGAGSVALMLALLARRPPQIEELGSVSHRWIAEHRLDSP